MDPSRAKVTHCPAIAGPRTQQDSGVWELWTGEHAVPFLPDSGNDWGVVTVWSERMSTGQDRELSGTSVSSAQKKTRTFSALTSYSHLSIIPQNAPWDPSSEHREKIVSTGSPQSEGTPVSSRSRAPPMSRSGPPSQQCFLQVSLFLSDIRLCPFS